ncbi:MAG: hypothetical protein ABI895_01915 [Deltaproteobacteria bacterium]
MTQRDPERGAQDGVDEREARLARARVAFDQGLREASETGVRAARRLLVPALWGAALVGGTLLAFAMLRLVRRPSRGFSLLRVSIEPRFESRALLPAIGGTMARLALQHFLTAPISPGTDDEQHASISPEATPQPNGSSPSNGSGHGHAKA